MPKNGRGNERQLPRADASPQPMMGPPGMNTHNRQSHQTGSWYLVLSYPEEALSFITIIAETSQHRFSAYFFY